jgi:hypothetical protein
MVIDVEVAKFIGGVCVQRFIIQKMNVIGWCYELKGPNLHVVQAHFRKNPMVLHVVIY